MLINSNTHYVNNIFNRKFSHSLTIRKMHFLVFLFFLFSSFSSLHSSLSSLASQVTLSLLSLSHPLISDVSRSSLFSLLNDNGNV